jgi:hypothetical protein
MITGHAGENATRQLGAGAAGYTCASTLASARGTCLDHGSTGRPREAYLSQPQVDALAWSAWHRVLAMKRWLWRRLRDLS